ncbi:MAG: ATP synthase F0 subunit C [Bdellovibrionota bacterium]|nr:ATP synthase F0 subunit C [Pseudomonadota bacterium]MDY6090601.1 ATP synthase F0 subunit C [Bdellovibrionota bacterium]
MRKYFNKLVLLLTAIACSPLMALAQEEVKQGKDWAVTLGGAIVMAIAALGGTTAQGRALATCLEFIGRNPDAKDQMFVPMMVGLAMIESLVVLSFVIAIILVL